VIVATKRKTRDIVETLRTAIRDSERTEYAIAKAAGIAPIQIGRFLRGERDLTLTTAAKIADALGLVLTPRR
jgi:plasmid maintenance system antidote protein VapI